MILRSKLLTVAAASVLLAFGATSAVVAGSYGAAGKEKAAMAKADIVDTAVSAGQFNTLAKALQEAGLVDTLKGAGPFTVFAPTDAAFNKLPPGRLDALTGDHHELVEFVRYHVLAGRLTGRELVDLARQQTMSGAEVRVTASATGTPERVMIDQATIVMPDLKATNGVIHVIDVPLSPPARPAVEPHRQP